jgi:lysyl-tRNA synthetase class 2
MPDPSPAPADAPRPEDFFALRAKKATACRDAGMNPYGQAFPDRLSTADARALWTVPADQPAPESGPAVRIAGRLTAFRAMGKAVFGDLRDESGRMQLYVQKNVIGEAEFARFQDFDLGDLLGVEGELFVTRTGELTIKVAAFTLLAKALRPLPEKWHGLTDIEQRYRQRYLDLIVNPAARDLFRQRFRIVREIRTYLEEKGFTEVETPMLQPLAGGAAARPFETFYEALHTPMFLRIAPELYLKRLLVGGFEKIFELNRNFRNEGISRRHNPEFTMLEIYQAYGDCQTMADLIEGMVATIAQGVLGTLQVKHGEDRIIDLTPPWRRVAYRDLVREHVGADWFDVAPAERVRRATDKGLAISPDMSDFEVTHEVYEKLIESTLIQPTFVTRLPAQLVPLAKACPDDPTCVDVFELEINGQEIAPGYSELNDPIEQRRRFEDQAAHAAKGDQAGVIDEDFLVALEHGMPPAGGMGIGIDRLVMLLTGAESIRDIILFPQLRPKKTDA